MDGDTSTNDSFMLIATGPRACRDRRRARPDYAALRDGRHRSRRQWLAQAIIRDGEGATKFITVQVERGRSEAECRKVAYAIAHSPLVKTAFFASDPNLGRILAAIGYAGIADLDTGRVDLYLDDVLVARAAARTRPTAKNGGQRVMQQAGIHGARRARPRRGRGHGVDLRPVARLREHQRGIPHLRPAADSMSIPGTRRSAARAAGAAAAGPPPPVDWNASIAFRWRKRGRARPAGCSRCATCTASGSSDLPGIDRQKRQIEQNTRQFVDGLPANNVLLTGARGTGKSSLVKALLNKYRRRGCA